MTYKLLLFMLFFVVCGVVAIEPRDVFVGDDVNKDFHSNNEDMIETQQTICQINTLQLAATAKATVTRALKGICTASSMEEYFKKIESLLKTQLELLKSIEMKLESNVAHALCKQSQLPESLDTDHWDSEEFHDKKSDIQLKRYPREMEIKRTNSTMNQDSSGKSIFTYYWKLHQIEEKLLQRKSIRSLNFYITPGGYCMYLRLLTTQNGDTIYVQVGVTHGIYDRTLLWPFRLKHKLTVLDQVAVNQSDIQSRIWDPSVLCSQLHWQKPSVSSDNYECLGLGISNKTLHSRNYLLSNTLAIKLVVYL